MEKVLASVRKEQNKIKDYNTTTHNQFKRRIGAINRHLPLAVEKKRQALEAIKINFPVYSQDSIDKN